MVVSGTLKRQVAMSDRFLEALIRLPQKIQVRVRAQLSLLYDNPGHPSLNYETIKNAGDPRMRSVRVTDDYRLIVAHPNGNGTYLLLWVDKHDAAYEWAMRHRLDPGDEAQGLAIVPIIERAETIIAPTPPQHPYHTAASPDSVLAHCTNDQLMKAGVSAPLLPGLRACTSTDMLLEALGALRSEVAENVMCLVLGEPLIDVSRELDVSDGARTAVAAPTSQPTSESGADPIELALHRPESSRRFVVLSSQQELEQALNYPMDRWRLFLHPDQRAIVTHHFSGPALVSGGAGTGKTVVGLHRARYLASNVFTAPDDRILVTTYTHNLAANLSQLMDSLCGNDHSLRERIDVTSVHALATKVRRQANESFGIVKPDIAAQLMADAVAAHDTLGLPLGFYQAEWNDVALERDAMTEAVYLDVDRSGRGKGLNRRQRAAIWPVLEAYRDALKAVKREEWSLVVHRARELIERRAVTFPYRYRAAIVDEAQDVGAPEMRLLLTLVGQGPDSILLLGDSRQQIYARGSFVHTLNLPIGRRHTRLRVNYRTTEQISSAASAVLTTADTLTGEKLSPNDSISLLSGPIPRIHTYATESEEAAAVVVAMQELLRTLLSEEIAVVGRTNKLVTAYLNALTAAEIHASKLDAEKINQPGVQIGTMHRIKGLEFRAVFIVGCSADVVPQPYVGEDEDVARADHEERERHLLYVAMTRARELLWVSGVTPFSPFLA